MTPLIGWLLAAVLFAVSVAAFVAVAIDACTGGLRSHEERRS